MSFDLRALKIYIDGSCRKNPGGTGGFAARIEFPFDWDRPEELLEYRGYFETTNQRMEVEPCIFGHEWILECGIDLGVRHFQIITDSKYLYENYSRSVCWSRNGWRSFYGRPLDNVDQWKALLRLRRRIGYRVRVEMKLIQGKSTPMAKAVDRDARAASLLPTKIDRGFRAGKIGRSKNNTGKAARMFPAARDELVIRIYGTKRVRRDEQKVKFQTYSEEKRDFFEKYQAYADSSIGNALHRQNIYRVRMNDIPQYPRIEEILAKLEESELIGQIVITG
ncbi:MAG TPA: RNase H family protein [Candidatus Acidoferrales bacterium]|nr:RNase H family protein [Candidatus Acidoferrales bacterium]